MKISYAITVKDEFVEIQRLLTILSDRKQPQDEVVVMWDSKMVTQKLKHTFVR